MSNLVMLRTTYIRLHIYTVVETGVARQGHGPPQNNSKLVYILYNTLFYNSFKRPGGQCISSNFLLFSVLILQF
jgi:hypothetical protein